MNLPDPAQFNSSESEQFLQDFTNSLKTYINNPSFLVHLRNAKEHLEIQKWLLFVYENYDNMEDHVY